MIATAGSRRVPMVGHTVVALLGLTWTAVHFLTLRVDYASARRRELLDEGTGSGGENYWSAGRMYSNS